MQRWNSLLKALLVHDEATPNGDFGKDKVVRSIRNGFVIVPQLDAASCKWNTLSVCRKREVALRDLVHSVGSRELGKVHPRLELETVLRWQKSGRRQSQSLSCEAARPWTRAGTATLQRYKVYYKTSNKGGCGDPLQLNARARARARSRRKPRFSNSSKRKRKPLPCAADTMTNLSAHVSTRNLRHSRHACDVNIGAAYRKLEHVLDLLVLLGLRIPVDLDKSPRHCSCGRSRFLTLSSARSVP